MRPGGFYAIVDVPGVAEALALAVAQLDGGARVLQVRLKAAPARDILAVARALRPLTRDAGVPLVVNDRLDLALAAGADAVHLGQDDLPLGAAREVVRAAGARLAIGVSTHSPEQAAEAARGGADYLGFGPVFATGTKANPDPVQGLEALRAAVLAAAGVPVVAIGGIDAARARECARVGAHSACAIASVNRAADVMGAARAVSEAFASVSR